MNNIEPKLNEINVLLEDYANAAAFTYFDTIQIKNYTDAYLDNLKDTTGIYFFQLKKEDVSTCDVWIKEFENNWNNTSIKNSPKVIKKRIKNTTGSNWIPLYIGKSKTLKKRVAEHFILDPACSTYAMKLCSREILKNTTVRVGYLYVESKHYDLIMGKIEAVLRDKHKPIVGKQ